MAIPIGIWRSFLDRTFKFNFLIFKKLTLFPKNRWCKYYYNNREIDQYKNYVRKALQYDKKHKLLLDIQFLIKSVTTLRMCNCKFSLNHYRNVHRIPIVTSFLKHPSNIFEKKFKFQVLIYKQFYLFKNSFKLF